MSRIAADDPIIGFIIDDARKWGPRPEFNRPTGIVDEGPEAVLAMARESQRRAADFEFYKAVAAQVPGAEAQEYGDTPGAPGYVSAPIPGWEYADVRFTFNWGYDVALTLASTEADVWTDADDFRMEQGRDLDRIAEPTVEAAAAAMAAMMTRYAKS